MPVTPQPVALYVEAGPKRTFASAIEWPGWTRAGRDEVAAIKAMVAVRDRYASAMRGSRLSFPGPATPLDVVERVAGNATTDFGAPAVPCSRDRDASPTDLDRGVRLLLAAWDALDDAIASAPQSLRKGPRGGGRDRDAVFQHVLGAEAAYASKLGLRFKEPAAADRTAVSALRQALAAALRDPARIAPADPRQWPAAYAVRRIAWHALDHGWEIEDRS